MLGGKRNADIPTRFLEIFFSATIPDHRCGVSDPLAPISEHTSSPGRTRIVTYEFDESSKPNGRVSCIRRSDLVKGRRSLDSYVNADHNGSFSRELGILLSWLTITHDSSLALIALVVSALAIGRIAGVREGMIL